MNIKEFELDVRVAAEQDILVTMLVCLNELVRRKLKDKTKTFR